VKIRLICLNKTAKEYENLVAEYSKRIARYTKFDMVILPAVKGINASEEQQKKEAEKILAKIQSTSYVILLNETKPINSIGGKEYTSKQFANLLQQKMNASISELVFVIGGAYGFYQSVYDIAKEQVSLSKLTLPHQLVRLVFLEQLYRGFTILRGEKYHH